MIDLYTWTTPNGRKVSIALEELGIPYEAHAVDIGKDEQFKPEFLKIAPNNRIPAIVDRDNGFSLMESGAILLYLAEKAGKLLPSDTLKRYRVIEWLMWQMGGPGPILGQVHHFVKYNPGKAPYAEERYLTEAKRLYGVLDRRLVLVACRARFGLCHLAFADQVKRRRTQGQLQHAIDRGHGAFGTLVVKADGTYTYTLTSNDPNHSAQGTDIISGADSQVLTIVDSHGNTNSATISIDIKDDVPTAHGDIGAIVSGGRRAPRTGRGRTPRQLLVTAGALAGTRVTLDARPILIGRADDSTLVLDDDYASTRHARISMQGDEWYVEDLGSTNGTYLDRAKVTGPTRVPLGVPVRIGKTVIELRS